LSVISINIKIRHTAGIGKPGEVLRDRVPGTGGRQGVCKQSLLCLRGGTRISVINIKVSRTRIGSGSAEGHGDLLVVLRIDSKADIRTGAGTIARAVVERYISFKVANCVPGVSATAAHQV